MTKKGIAKEISQIEATWLLRMLIVASFPIFLNRSSSRTGHATEANDNMAAIIFRDVIPKLEVALALARWADSPIALFLECHQVYSLYSISVMCIYIYTCSFLQENPLGDALGYLSATFLLILAPCLLRMG